MSRTGSASLSGREVPAATGLAAVLLLAALVGADSPGPAPRPLSIDPRIATAAEFTLVRGVGPVLAGRIVDAREASAPWSGPDDLLSVPGVGPVVLTDLSRHLAFPADAGR